MRQDGPAARRPGYDYVIIHNGEHIYIIYIIIYIYIGGGLVRQDGPAARPDPPHQRLRSDHRSVFLIIAIVVVVVIIFPFLNSSYNSFS